MFNKLIDWAVTNRLLVVIALTTLIVSAVFVIPKLNLDAFPDVTNVQVSVNTEAPGLAAEEVEQLITYPIEAVMYALPDVMEVRSISKTGLSGVTVVFSEDTDIYFARQLVFERLQAAKELIPEGVGTPEMGPNTSGLGQVYQWLIALVAFLCIFGSALTVYDGYARVVAEAIALLFNKDKNARNTLVTPVLLFMAVASFIIVLFFKSALLAMLGFAMTLAFVTTPMFAWLNHKLVAQTKLHQDAAPNVVVKLLSYLGLIYLFGFLMVFIWWKWFS